MSDSFLVEVLAVFDDCDCHEGLLWRVRGCEVSLSAICNDFFYWGTADCEEITPDDLPLLKACVPDVRRLNIKYRLGELFAARKRRLRPQQPCYRGWSDDVKALFDACGPERDRRLEG